MAWSSTTEASVPQRRSTTLCCLLSQISHPRWKRWTTVWNCEGTVETGGGLGGEGGAVGSVPPCRAGKRPADEQQGMEVHGGCGGLCWTPHNTAPFSTHSTPRYPQQSSCLLLPDPPSPLSFSSPLLAHPPFSLSLSQALAALGI
eukprot:1987101-Rhodomonas_salina.1